MGRIIAVDYGTKRSGLAVTDPLKIIAGPLTALPSSEIMDFLKKYTEKEATEALVVGMPLKPDGSDTDATPAVRVFVRQLQKLFPQIPVHLHDERFTSKMALDAMIEGGTSKKYRRNKFNTDKVSAVLILQSFLATL